MQGDELGVSTAMPSPKPHPRTARGPRCPHHAPGLVVVQVHEETQVAALLAGVHKLPPEEPPKVNVVAAAPPVPVGPPRATAPVIAGARLDGALRAGAGHRVRHAGAGDGKDERRLPAACRGEQDLRGCGDPQSPPAPAAPCWGQAGGRRLNPRGTCWVLPRREMRGAPRRLPPPRRLTPVDDFAEDVGALGGGAVPAAVAELPLALLDGGLEAGADAVQDAGVLADQFALLAAQQLQAGVQHQLHVLGVRQQVGGGGHVDDAPAAHTGLTPGLPAPRSPPPPGHLL